MALLKLTVISILLSSLLLTGCEATEESEIVALKLQTSLILRDEFNQQSDSYVQGENIEFFLTATNISNTVARLKFNDGQQYDFYIISSSGTEVWRWSDDMGFTAALTELEISPGNSVSVSEVWNQTLAGGDGIAAGSYTAYGSFLEQSPEAQFSFTIQ